MTALPAEISVALVAAFVAVALLAGAVAYAATAFKSPVRRRLGELVPASDAAVSQAVGPLTTGLDPRLVRWSRLLPKSAKEMSALERRLASGGFHSPWAPVIYRAALLLAPVVLALAALGWFGVLSRTGWLAAAFAGLLGYLAPGFYLDMKISERRKRIRQGLPDVLDLLIVCLEAGSSLDQAVVKASEELAITYPALAEELRIVTTETRAGKPRLEAFKNLAQRTKVEDVRALVGMLVQTDRFGTSVAQALRTMADDMRNRRRQAAEEMAAKVGVKLVFPLVFFMFPALYVVILGPAVIAFIRAFSRGLQ
jgi:tight adherence protein C